MGSRASFRTARYMRRENNGVRRRTKNKNNKENVLNRDKVRASWLFVGVPVMPCDGGGGVGVRARKVVAPRTTAA